MTVAEIPPKKTNTQSAPAKPQSAPAIPQSAPAMPQSAPAMPQSAPAMPQAAPVMPQSAPAKPPSATPTQTRQPLIANAFNLPEVKQFALPGVPKTS
jgi:hypothetical protein